MKESGELHFTGSIPANYDKYLGPMFFEPYAEQVGQLFDPLRANDVLELCCGTGRLTRHLREKLLSTSRLVASDLSPDMLSIAKKKLENLESEWRIIDAQALPFKDESFDLVVCYFGYMLVPDKQKAFAEGYRVLRKDGKQVMATWDKLDNNAASHVFRTALKRYMGDNLPEHYKLSYSMHDTESLVTMLKEAGFPVVRSEQVEKECNADNSLTAAQGLVKGGSLYNEIMKSDPALAEEIITTVERELAEKYGRSPMHAPMSAIITQAWK